MCTTGLWSYLITRMGRSNLEISALTLLYHHINDGFANNITITSHSFRTQMSLLNAEGYCVVSLGDAIQSLSEHQLAWDKRILLTFDDAYQDFYTVAFPILQEFGYTATIFPVVNAIGYWNEWNHRAPYIAHHLSWLQIDELVRYGITLGCHTLSHHSLVRFDETKLRYELETAQDLLTQRTGQSIDALSYPYGDYNFLVKQVAAELFRVAFAVERGYWDWRVDQFAVRRLKIGPALSLEQLQAKLNSFEYELETQEMNTGAFEISEIKT